MAGIRVEDLYAAIEEFEKPDDESLRSMPKGFDWRYDIFNPWLLETPLAFVEQELARGKAGLKALAESGLSLSRIPLKNFQLIRRFGENMFLILDKCERDFAIMGAVQGVLGHWHKKLLNAQT
jgi:hypothetical protein